MSFLDAGELAELNTDLEGTFDTTGQVLRNQSPRASDGGSAASFLPVGKAIHCAVWQPSPRSVIETGGAAVTAAAHWHAMVPLSADVRAGDRLQVGQLVLLISGTDAGMTDGISQLLICKKVAP